MSWIALLLAVLTVAVRAEAAPDLRARAYVLVDARTGRVLAERDARLPWAPASTTKILTALLVVESLDLSDEVVVSRRAEAQRRGAVVGLRSGERRTVEELLYAVLLHSANDAAVALAEAVAGSVEAFVAQMNRKAQRLGARHTHFVNPHGLDHPEHRSTAYDLALLARAALGNPTLARIVRTRTYAYRTADGVRVLENRNRLLATYPGANGVKTGWTARSGPSLVASAERGGRTLVGVVLDSPDVFGDAARLLDFGFQLYRLRSRTRPGGGRLTAPPERSAQRPLDSLW
ncbi:D-alanyl-D-alanine carboxypeptidase DacB [bacterium HR32]|nr:D-alanyl-D-alanine carboxypeptidase DacB [bacterium HR32]